MLTSEIIARTRDAEPLSRAMIDTLIEGFTAGTVPDYQMAAWAMAVRIRGLSAEAAGYLTEAMLASGERLSRGDGPPRVDKHSTGGLGDKVSLILAPLLACCDVRVPMISGRGLGLSGGTLDKLEAIPGFRVDLDDGEAAAALADVGCHIIAASERIAPADRKLYALRDVTGCVESVALITASILSKKLAASLDHLVMDVKVGRGAFMKTTAEAEALARSLVTTGERAGLPVRALLTDMDQPLGRAVGNGNEVDEAIEVLRGGGPQEVRQVTIALSAELLVMAGVAASLDRATERLEARLDGGDAYERFERMVVRQGGRIGPRPRVAAVEVLADRDGTIATIDCADLGRWIVEQGGGRRMMTDKIDHAVGAEIMVKIGQTVTRGQPLLRLSGRNLGDGDCQRARSWIGLTDHPVASRPLLRRFASTDAPPAKN